MTFIEITMVVSLIALVSLALYKSFSNGLRVWEKSRESVIEEDIAIFFDKFARDLRGVYIHSLQHYEGDGTSFSFPAFVWMKKMNPEGNTEDYEDQMGQIEYAFDHSSDGIIRKSATYSDIYLEKFSHQQTLVSPVERILFTYYYLTDEGEIFSEQILETVPAGIEVEVVIHDHKGQRSLKRYFNIPIKI